MLSKYFVKSILVIDDEPEVLELVGFNLQQSGFTVATAMNGRDGLTKARTLSPSLIVLDVMMPEMDGLEAMRQIRARPAWQKLPIIALTAKAMKDDQEKCLAAGANDYLAKPIDIEKLLSLVRVWMPK